MKQTITLRRVETRQIELEVPEELSSETIARLANDRLVGVGAPAWGNTTSHQLSDWAVVGAKAKTPARARAKTPARTSGRRRPK